MAKREVDKYSNILAIDIEMSAADVLTFQDVNVGLNIFDKVGILINRMDVEINNATKSALDSAAASIDIGLTQSNQIAALSLQQRAVIDKIKIGGIGTIATGFAIVREPFSVTYGDLPGNGLLISPSPLWIAMDSTGFATVIGFCTVRIYFTVVDLKPEEYFELLEARRFFG